MDAEIDECSAHAKDAARLGERPRYVVEVGVREDRDDSVELASCKGKGVSVALHELRKIPGVLPRRPELIDRNVRPDD